MPLRAFYPTILSNWLVSVCLLHAIHHQQYDVISEATHTADCFHFDRGAINYTMLSLRAQRGNLIVKNLSRIYA
jgi:hypothetical protein